VFKRKTHKDNKDLYNVTLDQMNTSYAKWSIVVFRKKKKHLTLGSDYQNTQEMQICNNLIKTLSSHLIAQA